MGTSDYSAFDPFKLPPAVSLPVMEKPEEAVACVGGGSGAATNDVVRRQAQSPAREWTACPSRERSFVIAAKWRRANTRIRKALRLSRSVDAPPGTKGHWLLDNSTLLYHTLQETHGALKQMQELPQIVTVQGQRLPRAWAAAVRYLELADCELDPGHLRTFLQAFQEGSPFMGAELGMVRPFLQLFLLENLGHFAQNLFSDPNGADRAGEDGARRVLTSLRNLMRVDWQELFEQLSAIEQILRQDPAAMYPSMDPESRAEYRWVVEALSARSACDESDVAREALRLAGGPHDAAGPQVQERRRHVGFYLVDDGQGALKQAIGYRASVAERVRETVRIWPTSFYLGTIALATLAILAVIRAEFASPAATLRELVILAAFLIPAMEGAIGATNILVTYLIKPRRLPRLDFSEGVPAEAAALVAIPILLINEEQVRQAVRDLEIRYLANRDPNVHFALVTDPPDSFAAVDERDALAGLCSALILELNEKYARRPAGAFIHLHRQRAHNSSEGIWMGWERKRGKMLDLNNLILNKTDHFPVKAGDVAVLSQIRYVITLDQDTQLPRDSARELIGALAHPLNRAVVDPITNRVVEGYAILQPRVAVSIKARNSSRLAAIFSGDTGFDIYTRAVSDVYQDLFGAGIYTGKGIYEVETFQRLLEHRFPCNAILSHDLIEGSFARAGLISDVEVVDDYPSHVSAYSRRKHRWVRGDWQIGLWLFPRVPESFGKLVPNPLSVISRWQIFDNLRRSLSEVATFALLLVGWLMLPSRSLQWTLIVVALLTLPASVELFLSLERAGRGIFSVRFWKNTASDLAQRYATLFCRITLLCHQGLVAADAVVRTIIRMSVTHKRLLQWETAAQAELKTEVSSLVESYLNWTLPAAAILGGVIAWWRPAALIAAAPFLILWGASRVFCSWLDRPYFREQRELSYGDQRSLRHMALRTWRFFREFSTEEENWLIPDAVQIHPATQAHSISPTNLGLLINSQVAAHDLGFLTLPAFLTAAERTVETAARLPTLNGHLFNWYDTRTLEPLHPRFISTADSGNLVCCLWTLKEACLELRRVPLFHTTLWEGLAAHLEAIESLLAPTLADRQMEADLRYLKRRIGLHACSSGDIWKNLPRLAAEISALEQKLTYAQPGKEVTWWANALLTQMCQVEEMVRDFAPWLTPEFASVNESAGLSFDVPDVEDLTLENLEAVLTGLRAQLETRLNCAEESKLPMAQFVREKLSRSLAICKSTMNRLGMLEAAANHLAQAPDFSFLYNAQKGLLSIGYDAEGQRLSDCYYDLLASEARAAVFVAIAKGDVPREVWSRLGRSAASVDERHVVLSWSGTMFEYLMPMLWMKSYPHTLLADAARAAVLTQQDYGKERSIPWGISESSCAERNADGRYCYRAFGVPSLAIGSVSAADLVICPYASFLALMADADGAMRNLLEMDQRGWLGSHGFYEACDFTPSRLAADNSSEVITCWMAHHQGMSLVAAANALCSSAMHRRFHAEPMVEATERLLQENFRAPANLPILRSQPDWLKASVPVLRNLWQTAFPETSEGVDLSSPTQFHDAD